MKAPLVPAATGRYNAPVRYGLNLLLALVLLLSPVTDMAGASPAAQPGQTPAALLAQMSTTEKVGQLFLVTFYGPSAVEGADIQKLITQYHVGGVVVLAANDNFTDTVNAPSQVLTLTRQLQTAAVSAAFANSSSSDAGTQSADFVPLFIALPQSEAGYRPTLLGLPNTMALGATWDPAQAEAAGKMAGRQLSALGFNLLLGPNLDLSEAPQGRGAWDIGTNVFGGNPFWAGIMGQAYIRGVHQGAAGQVAVAPAHFPGQGSSDRNPDKEVTTLHKSLEALKLTDLLPFFYVTGKVTDTISAADGLLTTHVRFQGFQSGRQTTQPISFDQQALSELLALPEMGKWRANGGLTVSGALGVDAIKQFYAPYRTRTVARDAFLAGNDLLYLADFGNNPRAEQTANIIDALAYFTQRYREDQTFAAKVDAAVSRILALKLRLYGGKFTPEGVVPAADGLSAATPDQKQVLALAQAAATLISGEAVSPPASADHIVFFTDTRTGQFCASCSSAPLLDKRALERSVLQLYGKSGSGQIQENRLQSFSFDDLANYLSAPAGAQPTTIPGTPKPTPSALDQAFPQADWLVFSMLDVTPAAPASSVVSNFLSQRPDLARGKHVVVFAFGAPYYLDTTDLSKVSTFYALYSPSAAFVETAARLLFKELVPAGNPPVSIASVGYDLHEVTTPDPVRGFEVVGPTLSPTATLKVGDTVQLHTKEILDRNGHLVPDGTLVRFSVYYQGVEFPALVDALTTGGAAVVNLPAINRAGQVEVTAASGQAQGHPRIVISVQENKQILIITATPLPATITPSPLPPTPTATPSRPPPTATSTITPTPTQEPSPPARVVWPDFLTLCLGLALVVGGGYFASILGVNPRQCLRVALSGAIGILLGYNAFALGLPGTVWVDMLLGAAVGLAVGWYGFVRQGWGRTH